MLMAFEDKRFYDHGGVDVRSLARAAVQLVENRRIVSGASTLTMQVARLVEGHYERSGSAKIRQIVGALRLEHHLDKRQILSLYLRLAPFGGNIEGVRAASLAYFGKEPRRLSVGEAALLVALPQSPEWRRPDRNPRAARLARDRVLQRATEEGVITAAEAERAAHEPVPIGRRAFPKLAPHLAEAEVAANPTQPIHRLTIDRTVQKALEGLAEEQTKLLGQKLSAAILAVDHTTGEVIAHVGSAGYLDDARFGAIDMVNAVRSPGSTLKPFIYGLAFEAGLAHPETLIEDRAVRFGSYAPKNFDEDFHGTVTIRDALAQSLNIPAVKVLAAVGPGKLAGRFRKVGVEPAFPDKSLPTLAMALGGVGLTLHDVATLYTGLARGGDVVPLMHRRADAAEAAKALLQGKQPSRTRLLSPLASWYVTDILKDAPPPLNAKAGRLAYKTGTSYGYRDAWAVGYDGKYTVAVWVGRPDGASTPGLVGRLTAAPILFDAFCAPRRPARRAPRRASRRTARHRLGASAAAQTLSRGRRRDGTGPVPRAPRADCISARPRRGRDRGQRPGASQGERRRAAADVAGEWRADQFRPACPPGYLAARRQRFRESLGRGRQRPCRPRYGPPQGHQQPRGDGGRYAEALGCRHEFSQRREQDDTTPDPVRAPRTRRSFQRLQRSARRQPCGI